MLMKIRSGSQNFLKFKDIMYTSHGHHIPGTISDTTKDSPPAVIRCGGPNICSICAVEAMQALTNNTKTDINIEFKNYVRKPFVVEAVEITADNIRELSPLIGEYGEDENGPFIQADRAKVPTVQKVVPGYWVTRMGKNIRCYSSWVFPEQFVEATGMIQEWSNLINNGEKEPYG